MTPKEINAAIAGHIRHTDEQAWLIGGYVTRGINGKRYPKKPIGQAQPPKRHMTDEEMEAAFDRATGNLR